MKALDDNEGPSPSVPLDQLIQNCKGDCCNARFDTADFDYKREYVELIVSKKLVDVNQKIEAIFALFYVWLIISFMVLILTFVALFFHFRGTPSESDAELEKSFVQDEEEVQHISHSFPEEAPSHINSDVSIAMTKELLQLLYESPPVLSSNAMAPRGPQTPQNFQIPQTPLAPATVVPDEPAFHDTTPMSTGSLLDGYMDELTSEFITANFDHESSEDELSLLSSSNDVCTAIPNDHPIPVISAPSNDNMSTHEYKSSSQILSRCSSMPLTSVANTHAEQDEVSTTPSSNVLFRSPNSNEGHSEPLEVLADESNFHDDGLDSVVESSITTRPKAPTSNTISNLTEIHKGNVKPDFYEIGICKSLKDTGDMTNLYLLSKVDVAAYLDQCYGYYDESIDDIEFDSLNDVFPTAGLSELSKLGKNDVRNLRYLLLI
ncbi:unnamed protein product [Ambrosiozyma monospora]|uniref:Unnamed protein product n=1 Tax=Ambrosiozyma monospora TaxID=43982 RepID=A0A9W6YV28_AMBMO|nr:unnamed protein product [Ambrosiozyma monospora]